MAESNHKPFIFVGTESSGLLRSAPGEATYQELTNGLPEEPQVRAMAAHPSNASRIYAGTQDGVYRSDDHGERWDRMDFPQQRVVWSLLFDPTNPSVMYAGTIHNEVYRSDNGGDTWQHVSTINSPDVCDIGFAPRILGLSTTVDNPQEMYAAMEIGGAAYSLDAGGSWTIANRDLAPQENLLDLHGVASSSGRVFISNREGVWRSTDRGDHWENLTLQRFSPIFYSRGVRVDPNQAQTVYACVGSDFRGDKGGILRSNDLGDTWERFDHGQSVDSTTFGLSVNTQDSGQVYFCTRRGQVFGTDDGGATWHDHPLPGDVIDSISVLAASAT